MIKDEYQVVGTVKNETDLRFTEFRLYNAESGKLVARGSLLDKVVGPGDTIYYDFALRFND